MFKNFIFRYENFNSRDLSNTRIGPCTNQCWPYCMLQRRWHCGGCTLMPGPHHRGWLPMGDCPRTLRHSKSACGAGRRTLHVTDIHYVWGLRGRMLLDWRTGCGRCQDIHTNQISDVNYALFPTADCVGGRLYELRSVRNVNLACPTQLNYSCQSSNAIPWWTLEPVYCIVLFSNSRGARNITLKIEIFWVSIPTSLVKIPIV